MKKRLKSWITTILGLLIMIAASVMYFGFDFTTWKYLVSMVLGFSLFFDNKIHDVILNYLKR